MVSTTWIAHDSPQPHCSGHSPATLPPLDRQHAPGSPGHQKDSADPSQPDSPSSGPSDSSAPSRHPCSPASACDTAGGPDSRCSGSAPWKTRSTPTRTGAGAGCSATSSSRHTRRRTPHAPSTVSSRAVRRSWMTGHGRNRCSGCGSHVLEVLTRGSPRAFSCALAGRRDGFRRGRSRAALFGSACMARVASVLVRC